LLALGNLTDYGVDCAIEVRLDSNVRKPFLFLNPNERGIQNDIQ
jgi:hypothetical protein